MEVREKKRLASRFFASALGLDGDKHCIDLGQNFGIIKFQHPSLFGSVVDIKDSQVQRLLRVVLASSPSLESAGTPDPWLIV